MTQACAPPNHWWDITVVTGLSVGRHALIDCTCGETTVRAERTGEGWQASVVEPIRRPLASQSRSEKHPLGASDQLLVGSKVSLAGDAPGAPPAPPIPGGTTDLDLSSVQAWGMTAEEASANLRANAEIVAEATSGTADPAGATDR